MGWLIALVALVLLTMLPIGVRVVYDDVGLLARFLLGPVCVAVFPHSKKKQRKPRKTKKAAKNKTNRPKDGASKKGGSLTDFLPLLQLLIDLLGDFRRKLRVKRLELLLIMAGDDPCDVAVNYGKAWAAVGNLMPQLERVFCIKKQEVQVACDFTSNQTRLYLNVEINITLGRLVSLVVVYGIKGICEYFKICNLRKGGAAK